MPVEALRDLLKRAKVSFKGKDKKQQLIDKALDSPDALTILAAEARAQGEHIDGAMFGVETVDGSFIDIDNSMLVQTTQTTGAEQIAVRPSTLASSMRIPNLTMTPLGLAGNTSGNPSVRPSRIWFAPCLTLCKPEKDDLVLQTRCSILQ